MSYLRFQYFNPGNFPLFEDSVIISTIRNTFIFHNYFSQLFLKNNGYLMPATLNSKNISIHFLRAYILLIEQALMFYARLQWSILRQ